MWHRYQFHATIPENWEPRPAHLSAEELFGAAMAVFLDNSSIGGLGACGAQDGLPLFAAPSATMMSLPGTARKMIAPTPARELTAPTFAFAGEPGDAVFLAFSLDPEFLNLLPLNGVLFVGLPLVLPPQPMGILPASGTLMAPFALPALPPSLEALTVFVQATFLDAQGALWLATPSNLILLDQSF